MKCIWRSVQSDRWSFECRFDVNRSTFREDMRKKTKKNDFYIFVPSDLDLWPLDLKFAPPVTRAQVYTSTEFCCFAKFLRLSDFE